MGIPYYRNTLKYTLESVRGKPLNCKVDESSRQNPVTTNNLRNDFYYDLFPLRLNGL